MSGSLPPREPSSTVRGLSDGAGPVRLIAGNATFAAAGPTGSAAGDTQPAALDLLVGALVAELLAGFRREAARAGVRVLDAELSLSAELDNPLVALGVVGESGSAALATVRGSLYVSADAGSEDLDALWRRTLARAPVHATLHRCADLHIDLKPVP